MKSLAFIIGKTALFATLCVLSVILSACKGNDVRQVVVYTSVDEIFARPVARKFENRTGIKVLLVTDTEETKSTGLLNRLIAEKKRPVADVFWSGDPVRAAILKKHGVSKPYRPVSASGLPEGLSDSEGYWTAFSARARVIIYNRNMLSGKKAPDSILDFTDPAFRSMACMANPLFGTTSMHAAAIFQVMGEKKAEEFFNGFLANGGRILSSNGDVRARVISGECAVGITDTDDLSVAIKDGHDPGFVFPDQHGMGTLLVPNCAVLINGAPHEEEGRSFMEFLISPETERMLAESDAAQFPLRQGVKGPSMFPPLNSIRTMDVNYMELGNTLEKIMKGFLKKWVDNAS